MKQDVDEKIRSIVSDLQKYRFKSEYRFAFDGNGLIEDANALENPVMIIAPEGDSDELSNELRVWVYGGCIATISRTTGEMIVKPQRKKLTPSLKAKKENQDLLKYVKDEPGRASNPYDYGKYLYDGFTDGNGHVYSLNDNLRRKYGKDDKLGAYKAYSRLVAADNSERIDEELLDLMIYAAYTRWLHREDTSIEPVYAGEKLMQCIIAKNSMVSAKYDPKGSSMVVVDVEYHFWGEGHSKSRADFVVFDGKSFGLIEFKYLGNSMGNLKKHHNDFNEAFERKEKRIDLINELIEKTRLLCEYGVLDISWKDAIDDFQKEFDIREDDPDKIWCGFYFLGNGEDIRKKDMEHDPVAQIRVQIQPEYEERIPLRCKISEVKGNGVIDELSTDWKDISVYFHC